MEFIGQGGGGVDWINMAGDRQVADCLEQCNETLVPYKAGYLLSGRGSISLSEINLLLGFGWLLNCLVLFFVSYLPSVPNGNFID